MNTDNLRSLIGGQKPLILPCAYDALSARMIEQAGFEAFAVGGFGLIASRMGLPDLGLASFGEIAAGMRDIRTATRIPMLVDADDGYGDVKNVARTIRIYEDMGIGGVLLEDQTSPKRCGHMAGKTVVARQIAEDKLKAALDARRNPDFFIVARTDARGPLGLDEALERASRLQTLGADGLLVEAPKTLDELTLIGRSFSATLIAPMVEGGTTPMLSPSDLHALGFSVVMYPTVLLWRVIQAMQRTLDGMRIGEVQRVRGLPSFAEVNEILDVSQWAAIENQVKSFSH